MPKPQHPELRLSAQAAQLPLDSEPDYSAQTDAARMLLRIEMLSEVWEQRKMIAASLEKPELATIQACARAGLAACRIEDRMDILTDDAAFKPAIAEGQWFCKFVETLHI